MRECQARSSGGTSSVSSATKAGKGLRTSFVSRSSITQAEEVRGKAGIPPLQYVRTPAPPVGSIHSEQFKRLNSPKYGSSEAQLFLTKINDNCKFCITESRVKTTCCNLQKVSGLCSVFVTAFRDVLAGVKRDHVWACSVSMV